MRALLYEHAISNVDKASSEQGLRPCETFKGVRVPQTKGRLLACTSRQKLSSAAAVLAAAIIAALRFSNLRTVKSRATIF
ncbi:hypothetical protein ElyMa_004238900 [Elysia marginata]|uniref:Uncharacterized protein n=1 Tax=Elysia marginata TaxID=1093978 RepID=A0AAV4GQH8_9GAST|nr:hypothetical protein ElyMa_004238900 [Elysia marginata]